VTKGVDTNPEGGDHETRNCSTSATVKPSLTYATAMVSSPAACLRQRLRCASAIRWAGGVHCRDLQCFPGAHVHAILGSPAGGQAAPSGNREQVPGEESHAQVFDPGVL
jgi:hypothetical protein